MILNDQNQARPQNLYDDLQADDGHRNFQKDPFGKYVPVPDNLNNNVRKSGEHKRKEHTGLQDTSNNKPDVILHAENIKDMKSKSDRRENSPGYMYSKVIQPSRLNTGSELRGHCECDNRADQHGGDDAPLPAGNYSEIRMMENDLYNIETGGQ